MTSPAAGLATIEDQLQQNLPQHRTFAAKRLLTDCWPKIPQNIIIMRMNHRNPLSLRALLLLLLALGPLQAQTIYACAMMDTVVHDGCCCEAPEIDDDCANPDCDATLESGENPCCERSVEVSVDQEAGQDTLNVKPAEVRSDVDPPQVLVSSFDVLFPPRPIPTQGVADRLPASGQSGSDTYLLTQRLRI